MKPILLCYRIATLVAVGTNKKKKKKKTKKNIFPIIIVICLQHNTLNNIINKNCNKKQYIIYIT